MTQKITHYGDVDVKRMGEYPPIQRQLEALWEAIIELDEGHALSPQVKAVINQIRAVQQKYPRQDTQR